MDNIIVDCFFDSRCITRTYQEMRYSERQLLRSAPRKLLNSLKSRKTRMWANAQPDGRRAEHRWRPLFDASKFG